YTDPKRIHPTDVGTVEGNPVFIYHDAFNPNKDEVEELKRRYRIGKVGDVEVKRKLADALNAFLDPIRARRALSELAHDVDDILLEGSKRARSLADETLDMVRTAMKMNYFAAKVFH
ncbi:MAG: tryptophan--tRNA ligase, partial [Armatimonadetes bacterium]|nr:tryptophan--tRNA ligase [Armatimonadota bacterium]